MNFRPVAIKMLRTKRTIRKTEVPFDYLTSDIPEGDIIYEVIDVHNCCTPSEVPIILNFGQGPYIGVPRDAVVEINEFSRN